MSNNIWTRLPSVFRGEVSAVKEWIDENNIEWIAYPKKELDIYMEYEHISEPKPAPELAAGEKK